jgi:hypothetical protein
MSTLSISDSSKLDLATIQSLTNPEKIQGKITLLNYDVKKVIEITAEVDKLCKDPDFYHKAAQQAKVDSSCHFWSGVVCAVLCVVCFIAACILLAGSGGIGAPGWLVLFVAFGAFGKTFDQFGKSAHYSNMTFPTDEQAKRDAEARKLRYQARIQETAADLEHSKAALERFSGTQELTESINTALVNANPHLPQAVPIKA